MEFTSLSFEVLLFLFSIAAIAGFIDTLAGGGGLIALPALMMSGIPPLYALGTNKLQGSMGTATATFIMLRKRRVLWEDVKLLMLAAFIGSTLGTIAVQFVDTAILTFVIPTTLVCIAVYFLISPKPRNHSKKAFQNFLREDTGNSSFQSSAGTTECSALEQDPFSPLPVLLYVEWELSSQPQWPKP